MKLIHSKDNRLLLHIWRVGTSFELTKRYDLYREWNNIKFSTLPYLDEPPFIRHLNLRKPLPFKSNTFDVIYCNHVFEHLIVKDGEMLCKELYRILKPNGIFRIVVPDLEISVRDYIKSIDDLEEDYNSMNEMRYDWAATHLVDQMTRIKPGGLMAEKLHSGQVDWDYIKQCNGDVFDKIRAKREDRASSTIQNSQINRIIIFIADNGIRIALKKIWYSMIRRLYIQFSRKPPVELSNEKTLWMYDRFSLRQLLEKCDFKMIDLKDYKTSGINGWEKYNFDQSEKGDYPLEPSVYIEASKI